MSWEIINKGERIRLNPETIAASFKKNEADICILWSLLKHLDSKQRQNSGHLQLNDIQRIAQELFGWKKSQMYERISEGVGKYWGKFSGVKGYKSTSLYSSDRVIEYLQPTMTKTSPVDVFVHHLIFENAWIGLETYLMAIIASRSEDAKPMSYESIQEHTGLSRSKIYRRFANFIYIDKIENFCEIIRTSDYRNLKRKKYNLEKEIGKDKGGWKIEFDGVDYVLLRQLPNSYRMDDLIRVLSKHRPKKLKYFDRQNNQECSKKIYHDKLEKTNFGYVFSGVVKSTETKKGYFVWKEIGDK
jgi:hypothetical protein